LATTPNPKILFIILIITLNLYDPSLSGSGCNTRPNNLECKFDYKVMSQKYDNYIDQLKRKKINRKKKTNEEKEKKSELIGLTL
jgi:hypothetical protein